MSFDAAEQPTRKWVGVLLSFFVPGFGLIRAGHALRGLVWFFALQMLGVIVTLLCIWRTIPFWGVFASLVIALGCQLVMLADSFRPGRLNARLGFIFGAALLTLVLLPSIPHLFIRSFEIPSEGMAPTFFGHSHGSADRVIADRFSYRLSPPKRGDLVVFRSSGIAGLPTDAFFIQRLVGLPGEKIEIRDGHVYANGRQLSGDDGIPSVTYITEPTQPFMKEPGVYQVPKDAYFMLGDNSPHSLDGRFWGYLPAANVYGRVARIYYPFSRTSVPH